MRKSARKASKMSVDNILLKLVAQLHSSESVHSKQERTQTKNCKSIIDTEYSQSPDTWTYKHWSRVHNHVHVDIN